MTTIRDHITLDATQGDRFRCPLCGARRGLSIDEDKAETGVWHCFSCQEGGTGAELVAAVTGDPIADVLRRFGVEPEPSTDLRREVRSRPKAPDPLQLPEREDLPPEERARFWQVATAEDLWLLRQYEGRVEAETFFGDDEERRRWLVKIADLMTNRIEAERISHDEYDRLDSNTDHLDDA